MENQLLDNDIKSASTFALNATAKEYMRQTATWARIVAIASIVFSIFILIFGVVYAYVNNIFKTAETFAKYGNSGDATGYTIGYYFGSGLVVVIMVALFLYPAIRMLQFSKNIKISLEKNDLPTIEIAMKRLRSVFRFYGILTIITVVFYTFAIIISLIQLGAASNQ